MIPTVESIKVTCRDLLGDTQVANGEVYTDGELQQSFAVVWQELFQEMEKHQLPRSERVTHWLLPAYSSLLYPSQFAPTNFGDLVSVEERGTVSSATITGISNASPMVVTVGGTHPFANNDEVQIYGVTGAIEANDRWLISVQSTSTFALNGSLAPATAYAAGGVAVRSTEGFVEMEQVSSLNRQSVSSALRFYTWDEDILRFSGANQTRELRITYQLSGAAPTTGSVGIDNCQDFVATATAALAGGKKGADPQRIAELRVLAYGGALNGSRHDGYLYNFIQPRVRQLQHDPVQQPRYRAGMLLRRPFRTNLFVAAPTTGGTAMPLYETPIGTINGVNASFTVSRTPTNGMMLFVNGVTQYPGIGYTLVNAVITFAADAIPVAGDVLMAILF